MSLREERLKLGKSSAFVKRDLRPLPLTDAEFEADFFLDQRHSTRRLEAWMGMVIEREFGGILAIVDVVRPPPTVNDLATLLARAMSRPPQFENRQRPRVIHLRDRPAWRELLPHLRQLGIEVVLGDDLPWFDEAVVEWLRGEATCSERFRVDEIKKDLKGPFPVKKRTSLDATMDLMHWTDELLKASCRSARKGTPTTFDPLSSVSIALTPGDLTSILTATEIARTKKLRPRLEAMRATRQDVELSVSEWGRVIFALCGAMGDNKECKQLFGIARRIAECLSEKLGYESPPTLNSRKTNAASTRNVPATRRPF